MDNLIFGFVTDWIGLVAILVNAAIFTDILSDTLSQLFELVIDGVVASRAGAGIRRTWTRISVGYQRVDFRVILFDMATANFLFMSLSLRAF